jgi:uncharacterized oligopeptide transporter (OPT) family protein
MSLATSSEAMPEFTVRSSTLDSNVFRILTGVQSKLSAVLIGLAIGCLLCFTNLYFGLQTGWISMMSLQSALIGFLISKMLPIPLTPQQVIVVQTTAVATGTMPLAAGFVGILPALGLLDEERDGTAPVNLSWIAVIAWSCSIAFFGVFLSPPLRKQVIIEEQLAFPSGTATAQLISVLHDMPPPDTSVRRRAGYSPIDDDDSIQASSSVPDIPATPDTPRYDAIPSSELATGHPLDRENAVQKTGWKALTYSFIASSVMTLAAYFFPVVFTIPLFGTYLAKNWLWTFTPSLSYVGQGIIMGFPTTLSMNLGMLVGWGMLSPLAKLNGWAPGPVGDMTTGSRGWILWVSLAIMCADSLVSLLPVVVDYISSQIRHVPSHSKFSEHETETEDRLVPTSWVIWGLCVTIPLGVVLVWIVFGADGIKPWATLIGFLFGILLSILGVRALGETDLNPVSGLGKLSQLLFAYLQPNSVVASIIAGGVAEAGAQQAGDLMQDLKTGHLCGASPRAQFYGQLIGSSVSIVVTTGVWEMYKRAYEIPGKMFPAPTAWVWLGLARLLRDGNLPEKSQLFMVIFAIISAATSGLKSYSGRKGSAYTKYIPSGVAFAIGFLNTPSFSIARLLGGLTEYLYYRRTKDKGDITLVVIARFAHSPSFAFCP